MTLSCTDKADKVGVALKLVTLSPPLPLNSIVRSRVVAPPGDDHVTQPFSTCLACDAIDLQTKLPNPLVI